MNLPITVVSPLTLRENRVVARIASDGAEPKQVAAQTRKAAELGYVHFCVAIGTYYPSVRGGYYLNFALLRLVQESLSAIRCCVVLRETLEYGRSNPNELEGILNRDEEYVIVRDDRVVGHLTLWAYDAGGGSDFYRDAIVLDIHSGLSFAEECFSSIELRCASCNVAFVRYRDV